MNHNPEIQKLRTRLNNSKASSMEYRMTVSAARALLAEIDSILQKIPATLATPEPIPSSDPQILRIHTMDGGMM